MEIKCNKTNYFGYKREEKPNPFIGIMSFQHFRGDPIYSDCVVEPKNNFCETEHYECYPIPDYVEQNGWEEGYYPDSSVAYFRVLWKEFEPEEGVYNYDFIEKILRTAESKGQTVIFRLIPHSTRESDDIPDWLKDIIEYYPKRPAGERVKQSPLDPRYIDYFARAIAKIGQRFDSDPILDSVDICLPGSWGEGHNLFLFPKCDIQKLYDAFTENFHETRLIGQVGRPDLLYYVREKCKVGWRGDGLGEPVHSFKSYPAKVAKVADMWRESPVSFESYWWLGEWKRKGWDIDEIISLTLKWHISSFNPKSLPIPFEWKEKVEYWLSKMGYHFMVDYVKYPEKASAGDNVEIKIGFDNVGVAPIYNPAALSIRLSSENGEYIFPTSADVNGWLPGKNPERFYIDLPEDMANGEYSLEINISNPVMGSIALCSDADEKDGWYSLAKIQIED